MVMGPEGRGLMRGGVSWEELLCLLLSHISCITPARLLCRCSTCNINILKLISFVCILPLSILK